MGSCHPIVDFWGCFLAPDLRQSQHSLWSCSLWVGIEFLQYSVAHIDPLVLLAPAVHTPFINAVSRMRERESRIPCIWGIPQALPWPEKRRATLSRSSWKSGCAGRNLCQALQRWVVSRRAVDDLEDIREFWVRESIYYIDRDCYYTVSMARVRK